MAEGRLHSEGDEDESGLISEGDEDEASLTMPPAQPVPATLPPAALPAKPLVIYAQPEDEERREEEEYKRRVLTRIIFYVSLHIPMAIFMFLYKSKVVDRVPSLGPESGDSHVKQDFEVPLFYCFDDHEMCLHASCCGACRVGHTMQAAGILEYYPVIFLLSIVGGRGNYCFSAIFRTYFRYKLRQKLGIRENLPMDCVVSWFCPCCAIAQEAKAVDQELGVTVGCCFDLQVAGFIQGGGGQIRVRNPQEEDSGLASAGTHRGNRGGEEAE